MPLKRVRLHFKHLKCERNCYGQTDEGTTQTHEGKTVYPPPLERVINIIIFNGN